MGKKEEAMAKLADMYPDRYKRMEKPNEEEIEEEIEEEGEEHKEVEEKESEGIDIGTLMQIFMGLMGLILLAIVMTIGGNVLNAIQTQANAPSSVPPQDNVTMGAYSALSSLSSVLPTVATILGAVVVIGIMIPFTSNIFGDKV